MRSDRPPPATAAGPPALPDVSAGDFEGECVELFAEVVQVFGVPRSVGQIYGLLFASPDPLSFSDIVARLEISKGSASQGLQLLRSLGAVRTVAAQDGSSPAAAQRPALSGQAGVPPEGGGPVSATTRATLSGGEPRRRDYYEPELGLRRLMSGVLRERVAPLANAGADRLERLRALAEGSGAAKTFHLKQVRQLATWRKRLRLVLPVIVTLLGPK